MAIQKKFVVWGYMKVFTKIFIISILLFMPDLAFSQMNITISGAGACFKVLTIGINKTTPCDPTLTTYPGSASPSYNDSTAACTYNVQEEDGCYIVHNVCCNLQPDDYGNDTVGKMIVNSVAYGSEAVQAESTFNIWAASAATPAAPSGYVSTGYFSGYAYESVYDYSTDTSSLYVYAWKRSVNKYSALAVSAVGGVGGTGGATGGGTGGGTGGITGADITTALDGSLGPGGTGASGIGGAVGDALDNLLGSGSGYGSGSFGSPGAGSGTGTPSSTGTFGTAYKGKNADNTDKKSSSDLGTRFNSFTNTIKSSSLFSIHTNLMGGVPTGGTPTLSFDAGRYGSHSYDFSDSVWTSVLLVLKSIILLIFGFVSVRVLILKH